MVEGVACGGHHSSHSDFLDRCLHRSPQAGLAAGDYVLGFRWDCEETAQIWSSCADVSIGV